MYSRDRVGQARLNARHELLHSIHSLAFRIALATGNVLVDENESTATKKIFIGYGYGRI